MTIRQLALVGDSLVVGGEASDLYGQGGKGNWAEIVTDRLANLRGLGPLLSSGFRITGMGAVPTEWAYSSGWTNVVSTDAWDRAPYGGSQFVQCSKYANGVAKTVTWTKPAQWKRAIVGFSLYWIDYTNGGNWQYRIDGGTWTNMGQTLAHDNKLCKFYVASAVTSTVDLRCYDGASDVGCLPVGIEVFYSTATDGLIVHNVAIQGAELHELVVGTSGDRLAFFDQVKLGTGSPITNQPNIGTVMMHINDSTLIQNTTTWATDLTTFNTRCAPRGPVAFVNPHEGGTTTTTSQANYRAQTKTTGASLSAKVFDIWDAWNANGFTANAGAVAAGYVIGDGTHYTQAGGFKVAELLYWFIRNQVINLSGVANTYVTAGKKATVVATGKAASVAYAGAAPIAIA